MILNWPPQFGQCAMSISNTRLSSVNRKIEWYVFMPTGSPALGGRPGSFGGVLAGPVAH